MLTERQRAILDFILDFRRRNGCSPSIPEIQKAFSIRSPNGVAGHLLALESKGWIRRVRRGSRQIEVTGPMDGLRRPVHDVPLYGDSQAGTPLGCVTVDEATLGFQPGPTCFALRADDRDLPNSGLLPGDLLVVDPTARPRQGRLVAVSRQGRLELERYVRSVRSAPPVRGVVRTLIRRLA